MNIPFDINLVNDFIAWLIHADIFSWTFVHVTYNLHVLDNVLEILGLYKNNLLNSAWTFWSTFWATFWTNFVNSELVHEFKCHLISCILVWLNFICVLVNHSRTHKYQELSKSINPLITIDAFNDFLIQSQNHYKIRSCHICSCMFLVWTLIYGFALLNLLSNLLNNLLNFFWVHTYELQNVSSGLLPFRCSSTLWTLWRLFIYFLQKLLEAYKWEIICFDK